MKDLQFCEDNLELSYQEKMEKTPGQGSRYSVHTTSSQDYCEGYIWMGALVAIVLLT